MFSSLPRARAPVPKVSDELEAETRRMEARVAKMRQEREAFSASLSAAGGASGGPLWPSAAAGTRTSVRAAAGGSGIGAGGAAAAAGGSGALARGGRSVLGPTLSSAKKSAATISEELKSFLMTTRKGEGTGPLIAATSGGLGVSGGGLAGGSSSASVDPSAASLRANIRATVRAGMAGDPVAALSYTGAASLLSGGSSSNSSGSVPTAAYVPTGRDAGRAAGVAASGAPPSRWSLSDVASWLSAQGLQRYAPAFTDNEITGGVLLDLTPADLDYLGVGVLGHRKMLLKSVDELRLAEGLPSLAVTPIVQAVTGAPSPGGGTPRGAGDSSPRGGGCAASPSAGPPPQPAVHWSHITPLKDTKPPKPAPVGASESGSSSLGEGEYDEAAQAAAFQEALLAWRRGGAPAPAPAAKAGGPAPSKPAPAPAAFSLASLPSSGDGDAGTLSLAAFGFGGGEGGSGSGVGTDSGGSGGNLFDGAYDEEAEAAAFQEALAAWRGTGGSSSGAPAKAAPAPAAAAAAAAPRSSCYNCFKLYYSNAGYVPPDVPGGGAWLEALSKKPFCSRDCYAATQASLAPPQEAGAAAAAAAVVEEAAVAAAVAATVEEGEKEATVFSMEDVVAAAAAVSLAVDAPAPAPVAVTPAPAVEAAPAPLAVEESSAEAPSEQEQQPAVETPATAAAAEGEEGAEEGVEPPATDASAAGGGDPFAALLGLTETVATSLVAPVAAPLQEAPPTAPSTPPQQQSVTAAGEGEAAATPITAADADAVAAADMEDYF